MSERAHQSLFFLNLPDLKKLCCVTLSLQEENDEPRSKQIKTCRELVLLYSDVLASPALDSFTEITAVMAISFFQKGILQMFGHRRRLQVGCPESVFPGVLQACLSYALITRLAPSWNKAGLYLIAGKGFLTERGRLNAVSTELSTSEGRLCISIEANTVRLPPTTVQDFDLPPVVLQRFSSDPDSVLDPTSTGGAIWCYVLPSMKKGQIITISRQLPKEGPFRTYKDLQSHWNHLYGYRLPDLADEEVVYCSVYFRLVGQKLFTYPLSCIRLQPVQCCPRVDLQGLLGSFLSDIQDHLHSVCGFPAQLTSKPCYRTVGLNTAAAVEVLGGEQINLTSSSSIRPVLTQLPPPPRPKPYFRSQPPAMIPLSQQEGSQGLLGNGCAFRGRLTQSQGCQRDEDHPSSHSSLPYSSGNHTAPSFSPSSSPLSVFLPASSFTSASFSLSSSSMHPSPLPPSQTLLPPLPKLVPIFKNKHSSRHVNVTLLRAQKQREQLSGGGDDRRRMTLPAFGKKTPTSSFIPASHSVPPTPIIPPFSRPSKPCSSAALPLTGEPKLKRLPTLSPASKSKPFLMLPPNLEIIAKPTSNLKRQEKASKANQRKVQKNTESQTAETPQLLTPAEIPTKETSSSSSTAGVVFDSKLKTSKSVIRVADVEKMARSNQLSKLNSATLLAWLKGRGVNVTAKHRKEELMLKVMGCLAET